MNLIREGKPFLVYTMSEPGSEAMSTPLPLSVLYVDDEPDDLMTCRIFLERTGKFSVKTFLSASDALTSHEILTCDVIISDYQMSGMNGISFLKAVRQQYGEIPFILYTGRSREEVVIEAINHGADFYLQKGGEPASLYAELSHKICQAVKRKQAETTIRESEKTLSDIINFLPDATYAIDRSGRIIAWNHAIEEMTGFLSGEMLGKGNFEYAIPLYGSRRPVLIDLINETDENISKYYQNVSRSGNSIMAETDYLNPRGTQISAFGKACPLYNSSGEISGAIESIRDISELTKSEAKLRENEVKLRTVVEYSRDSILIVDLDGKIHFINPTGLRMIDEEDGNDISGMKNVMSYVHPESRETIIRDISLVAQGNDGYISQYKFISAKNREIWVESLGRRIPYQNSVAILVSLRDITKRKKAEEAWRESEEQFRALTEQSPDIIIRVDRKYNILYCNPRITRYLGISVDRIIGTDSRQYISEEVSVASWARTIQEVFKSGLSERKELKFHKDFWFDCLFFPEYGSDNNVKAVSVSIREITQTKRNEEEREIFYKDLLTQREFTEALLDAIPIPVYWKSLNHRYIGCNKAFSKFIGISQKEVVRKTTGEIWHDMREAKEIDLYEDELISQGILHPYQVKLSDRIGKIHDVIISKNLFHNFKGKISGIVGSIQDITEYNQLLQDLKNREELFRMIITQSSNAFLIITPDLKFSFISPRIEHLSGFLTDEIVGTVKQYVHPDDFNRIAYQIDRLIKNPSSSEVAEFRALKRDGSYILFEGVAVNCLDNPAIRGILVTAMDITERRRTEIELSRTMRLFQTVLDSSPAFFAILDSRGNVFFSNKAFSGQIRMPEHSVSGVSIRDFFPSEWEDKCEIIFNDIINTLKPSLHEFQIPGTDSDIIISTIFFPIQEEEHLLIGFIGLDVTEKKKLLSRLDESLTQNETLERLVQERTEEVSDLLDLKDSLITGIAHELRTPLTPLTVLLPLLGEEENYTKRVEIIRIIESNTAKIANIVEKILHLANLGTMYKIEDIDEVNIYATVDKMLNAYTIAAEKKKITLINEIPPDITLLTSQPHLISVLDNVISNAVKYSKYEGKIRIFAGVTMDEIRLHIRDDGIGMSKEELIRIFEPFFKADPSRHDRSSPGLGLSVTKRMILAIGGNIAIESDGPDKGTEVILMFRRTGPVYEKGYI